jgi:hypothetical protein
VRWMQETRRYKPSTVSRRTSVLAGFYRTCVIDGVLEHSRAESVPPAHRSGRVGALGEEHGHRVLRVVGKDSRVALVPLPPAVRRAVDRAVDGRDSGPILRNTRGARMHRHAATRRLRHPNSSRRPAAPNAPAHAQAHVRDHHARRGRRPREVQIAACHADPRTTMRYDGARKDLDRHPNDILAAYMGLGHLSRLAGRT